MCAHTSRRTGVYRTLNLSPSRYSSMGIRARLGRLSRLDRVRCSGWMVKWQCYVFILYGRSRVARALQYTYLALSHTHIRTRTLSQVRLNITHTFHFARACARVSVRQFLSLRRFLQSAKSESPRVTFRSFFVILLQKKSNTFVYSVKQRHNNNKQKKQQQLKTKLIDFKNIVKC